MKNVVIATLISAILGLAMIGGALYWRLGQSNGGGDDSSGITAHRSYTVEELARYDGEDGNECLVAVDGKVYRIEGFALWKGGEHIPSGGRARCGLDLTAVIDDSPHGRSKLRLLQEVGTLERDSLR